MIEFKVFGKPQGKARPRVYHSQKTGKTWAVTPEKTVSYEQQIIKACKEAMERSHHEGYFNNEPLWLTITAYYDIPKSTSKKQRQLMYNDDIFPTKKPDVDNIAKVVCDALNNVLYKDDTQICDLEINKRYINEPCDEQDVIQHSCIVVYCDIFS